MKKTTFLLILLMIVLATNTIASSPSTPAGGTGKSSSSNNTNISSEEIASYGKNTSTNYIMLGGFLSALAGGGDIIPPSISSVRFDNEEVANDDFIKNDATLTATILDNVGGSGVSLETSRIIIDNTGTYFSDLSSPNSFNASTGALSYALSLTSGTHTITIEAVDDNGNTSRYIREAQVDTGDLAASMAFIFPNPFNPNAGRAKIAYQLNRDSDVTLYMFNEINQLVWKRSYLSGQNGARAGYNEIEWDGASDFGDIVGNGPYFLRIASGGRMIGKIKIAVLR